MYSQKASNPINSWKVEEDCLIHNALTIIHINYMREVYMLVEPLI